MEEHVDANVNIYHRHAFLISCRAQPAARLRFIVLYPVPLEIVLVLALSCLASLFCSTSLETGSVHVSSGHPKCRNINAQAAPRTYPLPTGRMV